MAMGPMQQRLLERFVLSSPDVTPEVRQIVENMATRGISAVMILFRLVFAVCIGAVFGLLGGLLGVALFRRKDLPPPGTVEVLPPA
jgi:NhaP-type Na+/H+ and K+/H+ antiporter